MRVLRKPRSSTVPSTPPMFTQSPTWKGRSRSTVIEPNRFFTVSWPARATAAPTMLNPAKRLQTLMLRFWATKIKPRTTITTFSVRRTRGTSISSSFESVRSARREKYSETRSML